MTAIPMFFSRHGAPERELGASETSRRLAVRESQVEAEQRLVASDPYATLGDVFARLAAEWREATRQLSSGSALVGHPAYLRIIGLGPPVLPLVLKDLSRRADHWFVALTALTGSDPVSPDSWGDLNAMRDAWLQWARERNLL